MSNRFQNFLVFFLFPFIMNAQLIAGRVLDQETNEPLENVRIQNLASGEDFFSNSSGEFEVKVSEFPVKLKFSLLGYIQLIREIKTPKGDLQVFLRNDISLLSTVQLRGSNIPQEIRNTPASVSILTASQLDRNDDFNLLQSFNYIPGIYVNQGALNTNKINIRGVGSRAQFSTNRIKAYINGIPLTTAEGELSLDDFDPAILERVEIYKGPTSSAYGAGLGGAINLFTKRYDGHQRSINTDFDYGSFNTRKYSASVIYSSDSLDLSVNYNKLDSDSYRQNGAYDRLNLTGSLGLLNKLGNSWTLFYSFSNLKAFIPSSLNETDFRNDPQKAATNWFEAAGYESYSRNILGLSYEHSFSERFQNTTAAFYNARDGYEPRPFNILDDDRHSVGVRSKFNYELPGFLEKGDLSFGTEIMREFYEMATYENLYQEFEERGSVQGSLLGQNYQNRNYLNLFAQFNFKPVQNLLVEAGLNFNSTTYELEDRYMEDEIDQTGDYNFDPVVSPRLGLSFEVSPYRTIYASVSHGFSTPSVAETLTPEGLINTNLKTEKGWNYETGFKGSWLQRRLFTELSLYYMRLNDLLVARRVGQDQYIGINAGKADRYGLEFLSSYTENLTDHLQMGIFLNSSLNRNEFVQFLDAESDFSGNEIPGAPQLMIATGADLNFKKFGFRLNYQRFGEIPLNDANSEYADAYTLLNFKLNYEIGLWQNLQLSAEFGGNNVLDEHYAASVVTNAVGFGGAAPRYYYPGNPRNFYGGISLDYRF